MIPKGAITWQEEQGRTAFQNGTLIFHRNWSYVYNLAAGAYEPALQTPWFFNETFAGATYIPNFSEFMANVPEPAGATALLLVGIAALTRRRVRE